MKSDSNYKVAVRCFTYNHAPYIADTLNGFAIQITEFPVVYIIVDDASTDGTRDILENWANEKFQNLNVKSQWRTMPYGLMTKVVLNNNSTFVILLLSDNHYQHGNGIRRFDYIAEWYENATYHALCEGDDYWSTPNKLQRQVDILERDINLGMCYTQCLYYYEESKSFADKGWGGPYESFTDLFTRNTVPTPTVVYRAALRKSYYEQIKPQEKNWKLGDYPFWLFISKVSNILFLNEITSVYRVLNESASHSKSFEKNEEFIKSVFDMKFYFSDLYGLNLNTYLSECLYKSLIVNAIKNGLPERAIDLVDNINGHTLKKIIIKIICKNRVLFKLASKFV